MEPDLNLTILLAHGRAAKMCKVAVDFPIDFEQSADKVFLNFVKKTRGNPDDDSIKFEKRGKKEFTLSLHACLIILTHYNTHKAKL